MVNSKCCVPNCISGYKSCKEKVSLFRITENRLKLWSLAVPRKDRNLTTNDVVCEKHFAPECLVKKWIAPNSVIEIPLNKTILVDDAIPTIFPNCPKYLSKLPAKRKPPKIRSDVDMKKQKVLKKNVEETEHTVQIEKQNEMHKNENEKSTLHLTLETNINLPQKNWSYCILEVENENMHVFTEIKYSQLLANTFVSRKIILHKNKFLFYYQEKLLCGHQLENYNKKVIINTTTINEVLTKFANLNICNIGPSVNSFKNTTISTAVKDNITSKWRHNNCKLLLNNNEFCKPCFSLHESFRIISSRNLKKKVVMRRTKYLTDSESKKLHIQILREKRRLAENNRKLSDKLKVLTEKMNEISNSDILEK